MKLPQPPQTFKGHIWCLFAFMGFSVAVWMAPVLLAGFPYVLSGNVLEAKEFIATGKIDSLRPMAVLLMGWMGAFLDWENVVGWSALSAAVTALALLPLWVAVRKLFSERVAWLTVVTFVFMPIHWIQAVHAGGYAFAFLFLFTGLFLFIHFYQESKLKALLLGALFYGFALASHHAFITFLPWLCIAYVWHHKKQWKGAALHAVLFTAVAYVGLMLPMAPNALGDMTPEERVAVFLPHASEHSTGIGHLYPDYYAYEFLREDFEKIILERNANAHFLTRQQDKYVHWIFGVGDLSAGDGLQNGVWLFAHTLPELLVQEYLGGAFLWIFMLLGGYFLYKKNRKLLWYMIGLWLSMEFILRFVLHYGRTHLMDIGSCFALLTALGVAVVCDAVCAKHKKLPTTLCASVVAVLIAVQLTSANRKVFAHHYSRTTAPESYAAAGPLNALPEGSVVAHPRKGHLFYFTDVESVVIHTETVDFLEERRRLSQPFLHYDVTHIIGYNEKHTQDILRRLPHIEVVEPKEGGVQVPITPFTRYILHLIR